MENEKKMSKRFGKIFLSIRSETNNKREYNLFPKNTVKSKKANSILKGYKSINENKRYKKNSIKQNIISKADTKNSSFDNISLEKISSLNKNKKRFNNINFHKKKELINGSNKKNKHNEKSKDKNENEKKSTRKTFKYLTQHRTKNKSPEKMKKEKIKNHIKTNDPVRCKIFCFLQKYTELNQVSDFKEKEIKYSRNNMNSSLNKMKSVKCKSKKECLNYKEDLNDENHLFIARIKSNESINKYLNKNKRKETYNLEKVNYK